ncbi:MAG TPA: GldG family protein [Polyangiaceae bacterium]|nr:GldG family protein [Polyangiaceae bacterium]
MATQEQKRKVAAQAGIYLFVIAAIVVVVNLLSSKVYVKPWDVTKAERYTLSQGSGRLIQTLKSPVQVDAYVKRGLPQLDAFVRDLTDLLKEYERAGGGKFKFTVIEPNTDELREQAKEAGLQEQPFGEVSATGDDQASIAQGYLGLVFKYGSEKAVIPQLAPGQTDGLEFWITNKIREIRDKADNLKHRIGVVTGKDELKLSDTNLVPKQGRGGGSPSLQSIIEQAFPFYKIEEVDLKDGANAIDKALAGLIITQPQKDYTEKELRRIDEFLMQGGKSLVVYASAVTLKPNDASMRASLSTHGLDKLLTGYGIQMNPDAVFDFGAQFRIGVMSPQTGRVTWVRHPGIAHVTNDARFSEEEKPLDTGFAPFFRMEEVIFPFPSSLTLQSNKQPADVKVYAVARTTPATSVDKSESIDMKLRDEWRPKPPQSQRVIAAVAEGKLKSAFAGSPSEEVKLAGERAAQASRVLVISSSLFLTNPFAYAGNGPELGGQFQMFGAVGGDPQLQQIGQFYTKHLTSTILSFKNTLDWMAGDADLLAASAKLIGVPSLTYASVSKPKFKAEDDEAELKRKDEEYRSSRKVIQQKVQWSLTLGMPFLFGLFGLLRWRQREAKRQNLKA